MSKKNGIEKVENNTIHINDLGRFSKHLENVTESLQYNPVKLKSASIKDSLFLNAVYTEELQGHSKKEIKSSCTVPIHEDLKNSFSRLHRHLAILCEEEKEPKNSTSFQQSEFEKFGVRGFSTGGSDESEGVSINGFKDGKYGTVNLNSPFTKYQGGEYPFLSELFDDVKDCIKEVEKYLFEGKRAPEQQLDLFDEELEEIPEEVESE